MASSADSYAEHVRRLKQDCRDVETRSPSLNLLKQIVALRVKVRRRLEDVSKNAAAVPTMFSEWSARRDAVIMREREVRAHLFQKANGLDLDFATLDTQLQFEHAYHKGGADLMQDLQLAIREPTFPLKLLSVLNIESEHTTDVTHHVHVLCQPTPALASDLAGRAVFALRRRGLDTLLACFLQSLRPGERLAAESKADEMTEISPGMAVDKASTTPSSSRVNWR